MNAPPAPVFVLGCGRLGSTLTALDKEQSIAMLRRAYDLGVRHFDTASIYGQGDSERFLGEALQAVRSNVFISTKAGQRLSLKQRLVKPLKPLIRALIHRRGKLVQRGPALGMAQTASPAAAGAVAAQRALGVNYCFEPTYLASSLSQSLRRLRTERVEIFYLHSPPAQVLSNPSLWQMLERARRAGSIEKIGVSCDDLATANAALEQSSVEVLQYQPDDSEASAAVLRLAEARGVLVHARLGAAGSVAAQRLPSMLAQPGIGAVIMGTTKLEHLVQNLNVFAAAMTQGTPDLTC